MENQSGEDIFFYIEEIRIRKGGAKLVTELMVRGYNYLIKYIAERRAVSSFEDR